MNLVDCNFLKAAVAFSMQGGRSVVTGLGNCLWWRQEGCGSLTQRKENQMDLDWAADLIKLALPCAFSLLLGINF